MPKAKLKSKTTSNRPAQRRLRVQRCVSWRLPTYVVEVGTVNLKAKKTEWRPILTTTRLDCAVETYRANKHCQRRLLKLITQAYGGKPAKGK